jgi:membrane-associated phospholipid phosphatase
MEEASAAPVRARGTGLQLGVAALAAGFIVLAALVAAGRLDALDEHAVTHWMPGLRPERADETVPPIAGLFLPFDLEPASWWQRGLDLVMYPASVLISVAVFALGALVLWRRGARVAAVAWAAAWFLANAIEVLVKVGIEKPSLEKSEGRVSFHLASFDHSFPSGHMLRTVLLVGIVFFVWRRWGWVVAAWAAIVPVCLVAGSWHVPSDVAGGIVFGALAVLVTLAAIAAVEARRAS